jgi:hypothetical protein
MKERADCESTKILGSLKHYQAQVGKDGSVSFFDADRHILKTSLSGASTSSDPRAFCLLAAHVEWQLEARAKNKPLWGDFDQTWQSFLRLAIPEH